MFPMCWHVLLAVQSDLKRESQNVSRENVDEVIGCTQPNSAPVSASSLAESTSGHVTAASTGWGLPTVRSA
ncbi:hypothetical protein MHYP_G00364800 [Metynnis hypsauchen]